MTRILVVDTSYLLELYSVPGFSDPTFSTRLRERMADLTARFWNQPAAPQPPPASSTTVKAMRSPSRRTTTWTSSPGSNSASAYM